MLTFGVFLDTLAAIASAGAGVYLLMHGSPSLNVGGEEGQSWLEIIAHAMGVYFIAKGWLILRSGYLAAQQLEELRSLNDRG